MIPPRLVSITALAFTVAYFWDSGADPFIPPAGNWGAPYTATMGRARTAKPSSKDPKRIRAPPETQAMERCTRLFGRKKAVGIF